MALPRLGGLFGGKGGDNSWAGLPHRLRVSFFHHHASVDFAAGAVVVVVAVAVRAVAVRAVAMLATLAVVAVTAPPPVTEPQFAGSFFPRGADHAHCSGPDQGEGARQTHRGLEVVRRTGE